MDNLLLEVSGEGMLLQEYTASTAILLILAITPIILIPDYDDVNLNDSLKASSVRSLLVDGVQVEITDVPIWTTSRISVWSKRWYHPLFGCGRRHGG